MKIICFATMTDAQSVVLSAVIAALVGALSWLGKSIVSAILWFYGRLGREREMLVALRAEIETAIDSIKAFSLTDTIDRLVAKIDARPDYKLFIPLERDYFIFDQVKPDITKLPKAPIGSIVRFYDGLGGFDTLLSAMQGERFEAFPPGQRIAFIRHIKAAAATILGDGGSALKAIKSERWVLAAKQLFSLMILLLLGVGLATGASRLIAFIMASCIAA